MTYQLVCNQSNTTGATSGTGTAYPSGAPEFTPNFQWGSCYSIFCFMCNVLQIVVCAFVLFLFGENIVLSVLRFMDSDYPFGILLTSKFKEIVKSALSSIVMNVFQRNLFFSTCLGIDGFNGILILSVKNIIKILVFYIACSVIFFFPQV